MAILKMHRHHGRSSCLCFLPRAWIPAVPSSAFINHRSDARRVTNDESSRPATHRNPVIRAFYQRLCQTGKATKLALTVCVRKLLTILIAMLKSAVPWRVSARQPA